MGCGLISISDILLYLAISDSKYDTEATQFITNKTTGLVIDSCAYEIYINYMNMSYFPTLRLLGLNGLSMRNNTNIYSLMHSLDLDADWAVNIPVMKTCIAEMLDNNIPVCLAIGPGEPGISFYDQDKIDKTKPYTFVVNSYKSKVSDHYITVTVMLEDHIMKKTYLEISSWGDKYYIDFEEYIDHINKTNDVFSNILYIRKK